jgi:hypothetical protein
MTLGPQNYDDVARKRVDKEIIGVSGGEAPWLLRAKAGGLFEAK